MNLAFSKSSMDREIRGLLFAHGSYDDVIAQLSLKFENADLEYRDFEIMGQFFLQAGHAHRFMEICLRQIALGHEIPWGHFCEAVHRACGEVDEIFRQALIDGAEHSKHPFDLARSHRLGEFAPQLQDQRIERRRRFQDQHQARKQDLMSEVEMLRTQDLDQEEEKALERLLKIYPKDVQVLNLLDRFLERKALRVLDLKASESHKQESFADSQPWLNPEEMAQAKVLAASMNEIWWLEQCEALMGHDFAVALIQMDAPEEALSFLPEDSDLPRLAWTRLEALCRSRHYVELLRDLEVIENKWPNDPETTFACLYYQAQALWGLGQKFGAIEILENIMVYRPNYRSAMTLLRVWKGGEQ